MRQASDIQQTLIEVDDSVLVLIDIQDYFIAKYDRAKTQALIAKLVWMIKVAGCLDVPILAMAENIQGNGSLTAPILEALPDDVPVHDKDVFGLAGNPHILEALKATGRRTAVCVGMETDVCVAHTAIGLAGLGYKVAALRDGIATTEWDEQIGLERMRDAGVAISSVKALYYEWVRGVSRLSALRNAFAEIDASRPDGLIL